MSVQQDRPNRYPVSPVGTLPIYARQVAARVIDPITGENGALGAMTVRLLNALADVVEALDSSVVDEVVSAPTDREALIRALQAVPVATPSQEQHKAHTLLEEARLRGVQARDRLLFAEGGAVSVQRAADLLHASRQTVNNRRQKGTLIGLNLGRRGYVYPVWQFGAEGALPGLELVLRRLGSLGPWTKTAFMLNSNTRLQGRRPLDLLRSGEVEAAVEAAAAYGEQGGS